MADIYKWRKTAFGPGAFCPGEHFYARVGSAMENLEEITAMHARLASGMKWAVYRSGTTSDPVAEGVLTGAGFSNRAGKVIEIRVKAVALSVLKMYDDIQYVLEG